MLRKMSIRLVAVLIALAPHAATRATQNELVPPTSGIYTGVQYSQKIGDAMRSLASCNKGPTAPANVGGAAVDGLCWIDDHATPWVVKTYVNGGWAVTGAFDPTDSSYAGVIGGGGTTLSAAATVDLGSVPQANVTISGAATITSFGASAAAFIEKTIRFDNAAVLTPSNALLVPGGFTLTTAAGDRAKVTHLGSGNWEVTQFTRANGIPIDLSAVGKADFSFGESVPPLHVAGFGQALTRTAYPAYLAKVTRTQNGTRTAGSAVITGLTNTAGFGATTPIMIAEGTGISPGCFITAVTSSTITLNNSACGLSSGTSPVTVLLYGYGTGGSASTIGVPDCRGRTMAGRDRNDPGLFAARLTSTYFGADSGVFGVSGGSQSQTLLATQLPSPIPLSDPGHGHPGSFGRVQGSYYSAGTPVTISAADGVNNNSSNDNQVLVIAPNTTGITINPTGGNNPHPIVPPTLIAECVVRVIP